MIARLRSVPSAVAVLVAVALTACSEEDRRAWVSILPGGDGEEPADTVPAPPGFVVGTDSTAVLLDGDTLMTIDRLPDRGPEGVDLRAARLEAAALAPDSTHVAFVAAGQAPVVGVWSRARQSARLLPARAAGVDRLTWAPGSRFVAWQATGDGGATTVGAYDLRLGTEVRHPVLDWHARRGRSVRIQDWIGDTRLRLLVSPGAEPEGGLAWMWELHGGSLLVEDQVEPLARNAPPESQLLGGGAFSVDALGDPLPESVALYVSGDLEPSGLVLRNREAEFAATTTQPLVAPDVLGLPSWEGVRRGPELVEVVDVGERPLLLLSIPVPENPVRTLGFFEIRPDGRMAAVEAVGAAGEPALFPDGRTADRLFELGLIDLDGDGAREVVAAIGRQDPGALEPRLQWGVQVWRWVEGPRLSPAPELETAALERLETLTAGDAAP